MGIYKYRVEAISFYDGDTATIAIDLGFGLRITKQKIRILGIDTPEIRTKDPLEKAAGYLARDKAAEFCSLAIDSITFLSLEWERGKYGRLLGDFQRSDGLKLTEYLVEHRLAVPYEGGSRGKLATKHRSNWNHLRKSKLI